MSPPAETLPPPVPAASGTSAARVLIIDDEPGAREAVAGILSREGYELHFATDGTAGLEAAARIVPDAICCDLMMPGMTGLEVCRHLKAEPALRHVPVLAVTALDGREILSDTLSAGADDFVTKPFHGVELRARLRSMVRISRQYRELEEVLRLRSDLSHMIVHDLRGPLSGMLLWTDFLRLDPLTPRQAEAGERIDEAGRRLGAMLQDLLAIGRIEAGKLPLQRTESPLSELFDAALAAFTPIAASRGIALRRTAGGRRAEVRPVSMDRGLVERMVDNLLTNAIKFTPEGGTVALGAAEAPGGRGGIAIEVADTGPGVPPEVRERIFEKFEVGEVRPHVTQVGLGLAFCKLVAEAHGGRIGVRPNMLRGAVFYVEWPG